MNKAYYLTCMLVTGMLTGAPEPFKIFHRGSTNSGASENTLNAFSTAIAQGAPAIELDIRLCASGELVLHHDDALGRLLPGSGLLAEQTLVQLRSTTMADGSSIATLRELFATMPPNTVFVLDIKGDGVAAPLAQLVSNEITTNGRSIEHFYATGFMHHEQVTLKQLLPELRIVPAIPGSVHELAHYATAMGAYGICLVNLPGCISEALVADARQHDIQIWMYQPKGMPNFWVDRLKPDAIIADY